MPLDLSETDAGFPLPAPTDREALRALLLERPDWLRDDAALLSSLGLRADITNVLDFGPAALARASAAHQREASERKRLEVMAKANFTAQARTHAAVVDVLAAGGLGDLARKVDETARSRLGLAIGALAVEGGETPSGWRALVPGQVDMLLGPGAARLGHIPVAAGLFGDHAALIRSAALARLTPWAVDRSAVLALGSIEPDTFTGDMGAELLTFLAKVVERTAARWPSP